MPKRRGHGEGSYVHLPNGKWRAWLTLPGGQRVSRQASTKAELREWATEVQAEASEGQLPARASSTTVAEWLAYWLRAKRPSVEPKTYHVYEVTIRLHLVPALGDMRLRQLEADHVQTLFNAKATHPRTAENCRRVLRMAINMALDQRLLKRSPLAGTIPPRYKVPEMSTWTAAESNRFLCAVEDERWSALYWLLLTTAMRPSEVLGLRWADLALEVRRCQIRRHLVRVPKGGGLRVGDTKTHQARTVILIEPAVEALQRWRRRQEEEREQAGGTWQTGDYVFTTATGGPLEPRNVNRDFDGRLRQLGLRDIRLYDLRHTCATLLLQQGVPLKVVSEMLGHASTAITNDIYAHVTEHMQQEAGKILGRLYSPPAT